MRKLLHRIVFCFVADAWSLFLLYGHVVSLFTFHYLKTLFLWLCEPIVCAFSGKYISLFLSVHEWAIRPVGENDLCLLEQLVTKQKNLTTSSQWKQENIWCRLENSDQTHWFLLTWMRMNACLCVWAYDTYAQSVLCLCVILGHMWQAQSSWLMPVLVDV